MLDAFWKAVEQARDEACSVYAYEGTPQALTQVDRGLCTYATLMGAQILPTATTLPVYKTVRVQFSCRVFTLMTYLSTAAAASELLIGIALTGAGNCFGVSLTEEHRYDG